MRVRDYHVPLTETEVRVRDGRIPLTQTDFYFKVLLLISVMLLPRVY